MLVEWNSFVAALVVALSALSATAISSYHLFFDRPL